MTDKQKAKEVQAALEIVRSVGLAIKELKEVPSGELYARVMEYLTLEDYNQIISILKREGVVKESNNLLTWTGP